MAIAGLEEGVITPETTFYCPGHATFYGHTFACDRKTGHGTLDLRHAIEQSCNVYFYNVGDRLGIDRINKYARMFGLVGKTGIDLPGEIDSLVPSTEWKRRVVQGEVVRRRNHLSGDRSGRGVGDAAGFGDDGRDGRQWRHARDATPFARDRCGRRPRLATAPRLHRCGRSSLSRLIICRQ